MLGQPFCSAGFGKCILELPCLATQVSPKQQEPRLPHQQRDWHCLNGSAKLKVQPDGKHCLTVGKKPVADTFLGNAANKYLRSSSKVTPASQQSHRCVVYPFVGSIKLAVEVILTEAVN